MLKLAFLPPRQALSELLALNGLQRLDGAALRVLLEQALAGPAEALVVMRALRASGRLPPVGDPAALGALRDFYELARRKAAGEAGCGLAAAAWAQAAALTGLPLDPELRERCCPHRAQAFLALRAGRTRQAAWAAARAAGRAGDLELALRKYTPAQVRSWLDEAARRRLDPWQAAPDPVAGPLFEAARAAADLLGKDPGWTARQLLAPFAPAPQVRSPFDALKSLLSA